MCRKELSNFKTFFGMTKVFPSLPLLLISGAALRCLRSKLDYNACYFFFPSILFNLLNLLRLFYGGFLLRHWSGWKGRRLRVQDRFFRLEPGGRSCVLSRRSLRCQRECVPKAHRPRPSHAIACLTNLRCKLADTYKLSKNIDGSRFWGF